VWSETSARYIDAYERITGSAFEPGSYPVADRLFDNLTKAGLL
jgi:phosphoribosylaminoimidazole-succinocarboxamide synthase